MTDSVLISVFVCVLVMLHVGVTFPNQYSWVRVVMAIIGGSLLAALFAPHYMALVTLGLAGVLWLLPLLAGLRASNADGRGTTTRALFWRRVQWFLHPSEAMSHLVRIAEARTLSPRGAMLERLAQIEATARSDLKPSVRLVSADESDDWLAFLAAARDPANGRTELEIRALGELGRTEEMLIVYRVAARRLDQDSFANEKLFAAALSGRPDLVALLFTRWPNIFDAQSRDYWTARATLIADPTHSEARTTLEGLAANAGDEQVRRRAAVVLTRPTIVLQTPQPESLADLEQTLQPRPALPPTNWTELFIVWGLLSATLLVLLPSLGYWSRLTAYLDGLWR